ncbi:hypothetical protein K503DRAFT_770918 [Rhizopogon vinicolor AM-OR11-026]|uniref:Uncharacterized protein n=1 Tax=Rhizopogon vinicolor AM-OR11-026 TaxID=1314800 RepID=A0A1B7MZH5_9AGAM|nr:hypothetical protein K503DRAFT_770918 [Rhizopogon vinicolor AM-OR11-026]
MFLREVFFDTIHDNSMDILWYETTNHNHTYDPLYILYHHRETSAKHCICVRVTPSHPI